MKNIFLLLLITCLLLIPHYSFSQIKSADGYKLNVLPEPKEIFSLNESVLILPDEIISLKRNEGELEKKAFNYLNHLLFEKFGRKIVENSGTAFGFSLVFKNVFDEYQNFNDQFYSISCEVGKNEIIIEYKSQLGLLFGVVTLSEFFSKDPEGIRLNLFNIKDYPDFSRRIISANPKPDEVFELMNFALKNKIESIAIASRQYPWYKISEEYKNLFLNIKKWKDKFGGPGIMQMHNIYEEKKIEISNPEDIAALKNVIKIGIDNGADKIMILADDTPPFEYSSGYILTSENDKKKFKHMADAHCYLMNNIKNWLSNDNYEFELYYVPPFYTYEDMHYGEMELYKNTPWEKDAFEPFYRDLNYIGLNMPEDVFVIWCGPYVRSRTITTNDVDDWTYNLKGVVPFLWDNTIYSHNPFISTPLFSAWDNDFPADFAELTAGNGMFINGDANMEDSKVSAITVNDYMWNSKNYSPGIAFNKAMSKLYGDEKNLLVRLKETELNLRKEISGRELWFESDSLWKIIRKIRYIHDKNPFDYHLNYTRMKGLRLQLKNSVDKPAEKKEFINRCYDLFNERKQILKELENRLPEITEKLKKIIIDLPDFETIK